MATQNWLLGIIGFVVVGLIILSIFRLNSQATDRSIASTQLRAVRAEETGLVSMIEFDFQNIGSNHPDYDLEPTDAIQSLNQSASGGSFEFVGQTVRGAPPVTVRYEWTQVGTLELERGVIPYFKVERYVDGQLAGMSSGYVTRFNIEMLDNEGAVLSTADMDLARQILVQLSMVSSLGKNELVEETTWESVIRPAALALLDYEAYISP